MFLFVLTSDSGASRGLPGPPGLPGRPGTPGTPGQSGQSGGSYSTSEFSRYISDYFQSKTGLLVFIYLQSMYNLFIGVLVDIFDVYACVRAFMYACVCCVNVCLCHCDCV